MISQQHYQVYVEKGLDPIPLVIWNSIKYGAEFFIDGKWSRVGLGRLFLLHISLFCWSIDPYELSPKYSSYSIIITPSIRIPVNKIRALSSLKT